jgi:hypothetical protein
MASGGYRQGAPGTAYTNRTDLNTNRSAQPIRVATGQPYGEAGKQRAAQQAVALPQEGGPDFPHPLAPSARPDQPVTAGAALGPGMGPQEAGIQMSSSEDDVLATIQGWYAAHPTDDLRNLLEAIAAGDHAPGGEYGPSPFR